MTRWAYLLLMLVAHLDASHDRRSSFQGETVVHRLHICQCLLCLQMALSAMSFVDNFKDVEHVADNTPRLLVLENPPLGLIKSF